MYYGTVETMPLGVAEDVVLTFPKGYYKDIEASITVPEFFEAPVRKGDVLGTINLSLDGESLYSGDVVALVSVAEAGVFSQLGDYIYLLFNQSAADE